MYIPGFGYQSINLLIFINLISIIRCRDYPRPDGWHTMNNDKSNYPKHFQYMGCMVTGYPSYIIIDGIKNSRSRLSFVCQLELAKALRLHEENVCRK